MTPEEDEQQRKRIKHLAYVGTALVRIGDDNSGLTDYLVAKEELKNFAADIAKVDLDPESRSGMNNLISYLDKKIDKRMTQYNTGQ